MISCIFRGGLGNFLFQAAATYSQHLKHGFDYAIPMEIENPHNAGQKQYILPGLKYCDTVPDLPRYDEPHFHYAEIPPLDNIVLNGYWQSYKFFDQYRKEILKAFGFKWQQKNGYCSVHIRLGDYLNYLDYHPPVTKEYLLQAMTTIRELGAVTFLVFSDSMNLAKAILSAPEFIVFEIEYSEGRNEIEDLELMSSCEKNITANSSFSLWAAYLNQDPEKVVISPENWYGEMYGQKITKDLYLPGSIIL